MNLENIVTYVREGEETIEDEYGVYYSLDFKKLIWAPSNLKEYTVKDGTVIIADGAFSNKDSKLETILLPNSVTHIGNGAFQWCQNLSKIRMSKSLIKIGAYAFSNCCSLTEIYLPNNLKRIEDCAFVACYKLKTIVIPESVEYIGDLTFSDCLLLGFILIRSRILKIGNGSFAGIFQVNRKLKYVVFSADRLEKVGEDIFGGCINLERIYIPYNSKSTYEQLLPKYSNQLKEEHSKWIVSDECDSIDFKHEYVDLGLSVKWATCNIGSWHPEDAGHFFAWGEIIPDSDSKMTTWGNYKHGKGSQTSIIKYNSDKHTNEIFSKEGIIDNKTILEPYDDIASVLWGGNWRMPTEMEFLELINNCDWEWTKINGHEGFRITSKKEGFEDRSIFLVQWGYYYLGDVCKRDRGCYWSSSLFEWRPDLAYSLIIQNGVRRLDMSERIYCFNVRPVCP